MRCKFCGWDNPDEKDTCEKCNKQLSIGSSVEEHVVSGTMSENHDRPTDRQAGRTFNPKATVSENQTSVNQMAKENDKCPECGYDLDDESCPQCGYSRQDKSEHVEIKRVKTEGRMTVRPKRKADKEPSFKLIPISEETGKAEGESLLFEGNEIILNRENTDPKNSTITSQEQATITYMDGKWSIEDRSEYKTTFVQAADKIKLHSGSLILIGNQLFRFEE
ncbi:MAG: hypothetical protein Q4D41_08370 [Prevotellaceae bacterium]|nr:hypothetical protein [Prevotellaceae bacterium]